MSRASPYAEVELIWSVFLFADEKSYFGSLIDLTTAKNAILTDEDLKQFENYLEKL